MRPYPTLTASWSERSTGEVSRVALKLPYDHASVHRNRGLCTVDEAIVTYSDSQGAFLVNVGDKGPALYISINERSWSINRRSPLLIGRARLSALNLRNAHARYRRAGIARRRSSSDGQSECQSNRIDHGPRISRCETTVPSSNYESARPHL
ncbi:hypothetical protein SISSUDRAFT_1053886, partial [Sistotremastrum suecicum HHB10207 ss-3]